MFQRWWRSSRDEADQVPGLVAELEGRVREWMRPEAGLSGSSGLLGPVGLLRVATFLPGQEELSLRLGGRGQEEYNLLEFLPTRCACAALTWRSKIGEGGPGGGGEEYLLVWGRRGLSPVPELCSGPTCPSSLYMGWGFLPCIHVCCHARYPACGRGPDELMSEQEGLALEKGSSQPLLQGWRCFPGLDQTHKSGQPRAQ